MTREEINEKLEKLIPGLNLNEVEQIGTNGMSNLNFLWKGEKVARIPIPEYSPCVDRQSERIALELLAGMDGMLLPTTLHDDGLSLRDYVHGDYLKPDKMLKTNKLVLERLKALHSIDYTNYKNEDCLDIRKRCNHFHSINGFHYPELMVKVNQAFDMLEAYNLPLVFSHGDIMPSNIIVDDKFNVTFIDFEYACIAPMVYDIACLGNMSDKTGLYFLEQVIPNRNAVNDYLKQYYICRLIQTFNWLNVAEFKATVTKDEEAKEFFLSYAKDCLRRIKEIYLEKIFL